MEIPNIPKKLDEWNLQNIEKLLPLPNIESEEFDFKSEISELDEHICAMANTSGGIIVLGIGENKSKDGTFLLGFKKIGFAKGKEEQILGQISDNSYKVEPLPIVNVKHIHEEDGEKFYTVIKITNKFSDKPYFVKTNNQCFVRLHNSKRTANRSIIHNLFSITLEQRKNFESLRSVCSSVKESYRHAVRDIHSVAPNSTMKIPVPDLSYLRITAITCEQFLKEKDLWGEHTAQNSYTHGINSLLHDLEFLNTYIRSYNDSHYPDERISLKNQLSSYSGNSFENSMIEMFDKIIGEINEFLNKELE